MKKYTIITGAGVLICAASVFVFYGLRTGRNACEGLVPEPANVRLAKDAVEDYRRSGAWDKAIACEVQQAMVVLQHYKPAAQEKSAIIFDIDETALSNWESIISSDFAYNHDRYKEWENSAKGTAIESVRKLYTFAQLKGFAVFLITGRREIQREPTERNLKNVGFTNWQGVFFKPMDFMGKKATDFKCKWREYIKQLGYTLVLNIGDQQSDLDGEPQALYNIKIANPAYFIR
jgi:predicted secreted acid phosphatase